MPAANAPGEVDLPNGSQRPDAAENGGQLPEDGPPPPTLTAEQRELLELYDRLEHIRFETALLRAYNNPLDESNDPEHNDAPAEEQVRAAEDELLRAKADYSIQRKVIDAVLTADATREAVHAPDSSPLLTELASAIKRRDDLCAEHAQLSASVAAATATLMDTQAENAQVVRRNAERAEQLCALAAAIKAEARGLTADAHTQDEIAKLQRKVRNGRREWRLTKCLVSAMVVGSGVNWAQDEQLRGLVVDDEDDEVEELD